MENQEYQDLDLDESTSLDSDLDVENNEAGDDNSSEEWQDGSKNNSKSNFKKLYKKVKELERENKELKEKATKEDKAEIPKDKALELKIFWLENPDSKEFLGEIAKVADEHNFDYDTAWTFLKTTMPKESKTYNDFVTKGTKSNAKIDYKSITLEESAKLSPEERKAWRKANWFG